MIMEIRTRGLEEAFYAILEALHSSDAREVSPRGQRVRNITDCQLLIEDPRDRLIFNPIRKINVTSVVGEALWYLRGSESLSEIEYYVPKMRGFSDDGNIVNSAYGKRLAHLDMLLGQLELDPDSRRAVHPILFVEDVLKLPQTKDFPCTLALQFLIRDSRLHLTVYMRANDVFWGLQHDVFFFTFLQEIVALKLGVGLGRYRHVAGVFDLYERHYEKSRRIMQERTTSEALPPISSLGELEELKRQEPAIREGRTAGLRYLKDPLLEDFRRLLLRKRTGRLLRIRTKSLRRLVYT